MIEFYSDVDFNKELSLNKIERDNGNSIFVKAYDCTTCSSMTAISSTSYVTAANTNICYLSNYFYVTMTCYFTCFSGCVISS